MKKWLIGCGTILVVFVIGAVACTAIIEESLDTETTSTVSKPADNGKKEEVKEAKIGDKVTAGNISWRVDKIEPRDSLKNILGEKKPGSGQFLIVDVTVWNEGKEPLIIDQSMTQLTDDKGATYDADWEAIAYLYKDGNVPTLDQINPNGEKQFKLAFDVPKDGKFSFIGRDNPIFSSQQVKIKLQ